jgi:hypothetical protein
MPATFWQCEPPLGLSLFVVVSCYWSRIIFPLEQFEELGVVGWLSFEGVKVKGCVGTCSWHAVDNTHPESVLYIGAGKKAQQSLVRDEPLLANKA